MKIFTNKENIKDKEAFIEGDDVKHIREVMRLKVGDEIVICDGDKNDYLCKIESLTKNKARFQVLNRSGNEAEPSVNITLYQALPKAGKLEEIITKATELGIKRIVPIETAFSVVKAKDVNARKYERYEKVAKAAAQQCRRGIIPKIEEALHFNDISPEGDVFLAYEKEKSKLREVSTIKDDVSIIVGAEGGFSEFEIALAKEKGFYIVGLGSRILRLETASVVLATLILNLKGDL